MLVRGTFIFSMAACAAVFFGALTGLAIKEQREIPECTPPIVQQRDAS